MKYNISVELAKTVLNEEIISVEHIKNEYEDSFYIEYLTETTNSGTYTYRIESDTFFFKCKKWANLNCFEIESASGYMGDNLPYARPIDFHGCEYDIIEAETEQQAVFDTCQWILGNLIIKGIQSHEL